MAKASKMPTAARSGGKKINLALGNGPRKAKTHKGRRILASRESELHPPIKRLLLLRCSSSNITMRLLLNDLRQLKHPHAVLLQRKQQELYPFENAEPIEYLCHKNSCGAFALGSTSKKRPNRLLLGRVYDKQILDMFEFQVKHHTAASAFASETAPRAQGAPLVLLQGGLWSSSELLQQLGNFFADFFRGVAVSDKSAKVFIGGLDRVIAVNAVYAPTDETAEEKQQAQVLICIRHYRMELKKTTGTGPDVELHEVGPQIDMRLDRVKLATSERWQNACRSSIKKKREAPTGAAGSVTAQDATGHGPSKKKSKNITTTPLGDVVGKVYVDRPDISALKTRQSSMLYKMKRIESKQRQHK